MKPLSCRLARHKCAVDECFNKWMIVKNQKRCEICKIIQTPFYSHSSFHAKFNHVFFQISKLVFVSPTLQTTSSFQIVLRLLIDCAMMSNNTFILLFLAPVSKRFSNGHVSSKTIMECKNLKIYEIIYKQNQYGRIILYL